MCRSILYRAACLVVVSSALACRSDISQESPAPKVVEALKRDFMFDDATSWLRAEPTRASMRHDLEALGFRSDGSERRGSQEVDGYSRSSGASPTGLSIVMGPNSDKVVAVNVMAIAPPGQQAAERLVDRALDSVDASTAGGGSGRLHYLGSIRLAETRLLKIMLRQDRVKNDIYSVMYSVSVE